MPFTAPSAPSISKQVLQQQLQQTHTEEKTLVYVLVKKPDTHEDIQQIIAQPQPIQPPSKPEVYFIKYKAQKEQQQLQQQPQFIPGPAPQLPPPAPLPLITSGSAIASQPIAAPKPVYGPPH